MSIDNIKLDNSYYAYKSMRKYPVHTKKATLDSIQEYLRDKDSYSPIIQDDIETNLLKAAAFHDLKVSNTKKASSVPDNKITFEGSSHNITIEGVNTDNESDLNKLASFIVSNRNNCDIEALRKLASYVIGCASNNKNIDLNEDTMSKVAKIAGIGVGDRDEIEEELKKRSNLMMLSPNDYSLYCNFTKEVESLSDDEFYKKASLDKIFNVMNELDTKYNNYYRYGKDIKSPEDIVYKNNIDDLIKEASDMLYIPEIDTIISKKALLERANQVENYFNTYYNDHIKVEDSDDFYSKIANLDNYTAVLLLDAIE